MKTYWFPVILGLSLLLSFPIRGEEPSSPPQSSSLSESKVLTLDECLKVGQDNYEPLKLADEEVELARLKRAEAYRALYPALSVKGEETNGKASDPTKSPNFTERMYGASLSHSLYEGGRIYSTYKQATASHLAAEKSRDKTFQDFVFNVRDAYWKLASAQNNLKVREGVRDDIKSDLKVITEQYVLDLAVKQQFLAVKAQYLQANSQANGARLAYSRARWNLAKALGLPKPVDFGTPKEIPFQKIDVNLDQSLALAAGHRPDLAMQDDLVEVSINARKAAASSWYPKLSLNTFYGRSASAFETDPLIFKEDWEVNARLTQSFWGSSLGLTGSKINTSPKVGQSTRSQTETKGVNLNFLDGMKDRTELKQADLEERQAELKRTDLRKEAAMDVEEAYYNLNQTLLQVDFTDEDLKLAQEELRVAESKGKYGLSSVLELAQARNRFATSQTSRTDSLVAYQIALAALNRAVGIVDQYQAK